jgi:hypothetical protein
VQTPEERFRETGKAAVKRTYPIPLGKKETAKIQRANRAEHAIRIEHSDSRPSPFFSARQKLPVQELLDARNAGSGQAAAYAGGNQRWKQPAGGTNRGREFARYTPCFGAFCGAVPVHPI